MPNSFYSLDAFDHVAVAVHVNVNVNVNVHDNVNVHVNDLFGRAPHSYLRHPVLPRLP
ncbi:MAG TPA: hypothetical protein VGK67_31500 [Myxococcales bacterium]